MTGRAKRSGRSPARPATEKSPTKPPPRAKSPGRPKSPARTKSPARPKAERPKSPGRPKSPARTKSPARIKSPAAAVVKDRSPSPPQRRTALARTAASKKKSSPIRVASEVFVTLKKEQIDQPYISIMRTSVEKSVSMLDREWTSSADSSTVIRRSARVTAIKEAKADEENDSSGNSLAAKSKASELSGVRREFGGWFGAMIWIIVLPLIGLAIQWACSKDKCPTAFRIPTNWRAYLDPEAAGWYLGFLAAQALFALIPVGRLVDSAAGKSDRFQYRCNAWLSVLLTAATLGVLSYLRLPVARAVFDKQLQLTVAAALFGLVAAVALYVRARHAPVAALNTHGNTGSLFYDFMMGRELNPRIGRLDIKFLLLRSNLIATIVLNALFVLRALESQTQRGEGGAVAAVDWAKKDYPPALLLCAGLQIFYLLDALWFESYFPSTFEAMHEGFGYMLAVGYAMYPFMPTLITKFLVFNRVDIPWYGLALILLAHTVGYVIFRGSNSQKHQFRQNPLNPALAHLETISTNRGKRLLVSGWWGWVRHPNYLGDLIMHWAWASTCLLTHWLPYAVPLSLTIFLLHRAARDNARCRERYSIYWERYSLKVRSQVIPKVF